MRPPGEGEPERRFVVDQKDRFDGRMIEALTVVKTYPSPSLSYKEVVCTAAVASDGSWIRLYPVVFRRLQRQIRFRKYDIVRLQVRARKSDPRPESFRPIMSTFGRVRFVEPSPLGWSERCSYVLAKNQVQSVRQIKALYEEFRLSLGVLRPKYVKDLVIEEDAADWEPKYTGLLQQIDLLEPNFSLVEKVPKRFKYIFECEDRSCSCQSHPHEFSMRDWEIFQAWRKWRKGYSERTLAQKIKEKFLQELCYQNDMHFILGSIFPYDTFCIVGYLSLSGKARQISWLEMN